MDELIDSFSRISQWLMNNDPEMARIFNPSITSTRIDRIISALPFQLPEEVSHLYQWHNGVDESLFRFFGFGGLEFNSLEESIHMYRGNIKELKSYGLWRDNWFPLFIDNATTYFVVCSRDKFFSSPIYINDSKEHFISPFSQKYDSLTTMMQTFADCYEMNAFEWTDDGNFYQDREIFEERYLRYNPISQSMEPIAAWNPPLL